MNLASYLQAKQLEHINKIGRVITEAEWVKTVLNPGLPESNRLSYASVNQWMNNDRRPDSKNIFRLVQVFGPEVMPYVGIPLPPDMLRCLSAWNTLSQETKDKVFKLIDDEVKTGT